MNSFGISFSFCNEHHFGINLDLEKKESIVGKMEIVDIGEKTIQYTHPDLGGIT